MTVFTCFDCNKSYLEIYHPESYRTFADSGDSTIGDSYYRLCKYCVKNNKRYNLKIFIFVCMFAYILLFLNLQKNKIK